MPELLDVFELLKLFGLLGLAMQHLCVVRTFAMQFVLVMHRRIRSIVPMRLVVRL